MSGFGSARSVRPTAGGSACPAASSGTTLSAALLDRLGDPRIHDGGELLWPGRFGENEYRDLELSLGQYAAASQLQQRPSPREGGLFKRHWFKIVDAAPAAGRVVRGWDFAATDVVSAHAETAWTAGVKLRMTDNDRIFVEGVTRLRGSPHEVEVALVNTAEADGKRVHISIPQDPGQAGKQQAAYLVRALRGFTVRASPELGAKSVRAEPASASGQGRPSHALLHAKSAHSGALSPDNPHASGAAAV